MSLVVRLLLGFLIALLAILGFLIHRYVGFDLAKLSLDSQRKEEPLLIFRIDRLSPSMSYEDYARVFLEPRNALLLTEGAERLYRGRVNLLVEGSNRYENNVVSIHRVSQGDDFVQLKTSPAYIILDNDIEEFAENHVEILGQTQRPIEFSEVTLVVLCNVALDHVEFFNESLARTLETQLGSLIYSSPTIQLRSEISESFNYVAILGFENKVLMGDWVLNPARRSIFALQTSQISNLVIFSLGGSSLEDLPL